MKRTPHHTGWAGLLALAAELSRRGWEFHEKQHQSLTDDRMKLLFGEDDKPHQVPRYFQRLVRDFWRIQVCSNFTIVWFDFFDQRGLSYRPRLLRGFHEHSLPGKFSFSSGIASA